MDAVGCSICQEEFKANQVCKITRCGHVFDEKCITEWLQRQGICPDCRTPTSPSCLSRVFFAGVQPTVSESSCIQDLRRQLEELQMNQAISLSTIEELRKKEEAIEMEKETLLEDLAASKTEIVRIKHVIRLGVLQLQKKSVRRRRRPVTKRSEPPRDQPDEDGGGIH